jgi:Holliday junction resolvasome RuvABC endonuclease subunit
MCGYGHSSIGLTLIAWYTHRLSESYETHAHLIDTVHPSRILIENKFAIHRESVLTQARARGLAHVMVVMPLAMRLFDG